MEAALEVHDCGHQLAASTESSMGSAARQAVTGGVVLMKVLLVGLAALVAGCQLLGEVPLVTSDEDACFTMGVTGLLVRDPVYGTRVVVDDRRVGSFVGVVPVAWGAGFAARRAGAEIEVLDADGNVVATTGHTYSLGGGYANGGTSWMTGLPDTFDGFWACGEIRLVDP